MAQNVSAAQTGPPEHSGRAPSPPLTSSDQSVKDMPKRRIEKWSLGILNDKETEEVPGTVLLLSAKRNEPLGVEIQPAPKADSSMPPQPLTPRRTSLSQSSTPRRLSVSSTKRTKDGQLILEPQPSDSANDPLNWPAWRRDAALLSLGFYCMLGGGMTPILAAGFNDVADTYDVAYSQVALTTGFYMMGLGIGSVIFCPTAILYGKRPVYLGSAVMFILTSVWCAKAPSYGHLAAARVFQGISVSPVECLPSATIAEIFFLHERAFRLGIYTLLLLGGKNLIPLVSAAIIQAKGWRWVFWIVTIVVGFGLCLLFFFVPETFWDRTPRPKSRLSTARRSFTNLVHHPFHHSKTNMPQTPEPMDAAKLEAALEKALTPRQQMLHQQNAHARFEDAFADEAEEKRPEGSSSPLPSGVDEKDMAVSKAPRQMDGTQDVPDQGSPAAAAPATRRKARPTGLSLPPPPYLNPRSRGDDGTFEHTGPLGASAAEVERPLPHLHNLNSPYYVEIEKNDDYINHHDTPAAQANTNPATRPDMLRQETGTSMPVSTTSEVDLEKCPSADDAASTPSLKYTHHLKHAPPKSYVATLKPWNGRLSQSNWFLVACRPFILFAYPSVLWSTLVYSLSVGWLIVLSEAISDIYRSRDTYNFSAMGAGLVYLSPFIGGVLGTAVAGKISDVIVKYMSRRNGGVYEPEFRLVMGIPMAFTTVIGLMGFGWSAQERDAWIVPTVFFGIISFGCSLGSTTAITFCVDSYRQYAGEALVTLNFSKNILHGLVFSLFFAHWLQSNGPKSTFLAIGGIQIACLLTTIPMYIYGKRARMWTVRKAFMENF
ncbi:MFS general substrate transporter, partial [Aureobasidium melanogenum]